MHACLRACARVSLFVLFFLSSVTSLGLLLNCHFRSAVNSQQGSLISRQSFSYFVGKKKKHNPGWMDDNIYLEMVTRLAEQKSNLGEAAGTTTGIWELTAITAVEGQRTVLIYGLRFFYLEVTSGWENPACFGWEVSPVCLRVPQSHSRIMEPHTELEATRFPRKNDVTEIKPQERLCGDFQRRCQHHNKFNYDCLSGEGGGGGGGSLYSANWLRTAFWKTLRASFKRAKTKSKRWTGLPEKQFWNIKVGLLMM